MESNILQGKTWFFLATKTTISSWNKSQLCEHMPASSYCFLVVEKKKSHKLSSAQVTLALPLLCTLYMCLSALGDKVGTCWSWPSHSLAVISEKAGLIWSRHILCFWTSFIRPQGDLDWFVWRGENCGQWVPLSIPVTPLRCISWGWILCARWSSD